MPESITQSIQVPWSEDTDTTFGGGRLFWENDQGITIGGASRVRLYPGTGLQGLRVRTNIGSIVGGGGDSFQRSEVIQFGGGNVASTTYPIVSGLTYKTFGLLFDSTGNAVGGSGASSVPVPGGSGGTTTLTFKGTRNGVESNVPLHGSIEVTYTTTYRLYTYEPLVEVAQGGAGVKTTRGFVAAFENGNSAVYEIPTPTQEDKDDKEFYRVVSEAVINEEGAWEKPDGWTGQPGSPTFEAGEPDPNKASLTHERVSETGYLTSQGSIYIRRNYVRTEAPYALSYSYKPTYKIIIAGPGNNGFTLDDLNGIGVQAAIASAQQRFGI